MAARGRTWNDDEVQALLAIWADASIQRQLLGAVRNSAVYSKISQELARKGHERDAKQCREKLKQLRKKYKEVVDSLRRSGAGVDSEDEFEEGGSFISFKWFSEIHSVMGGRASVSPPALLDSSAATFRGAEEQSSTSTSRTATPVLHEEPPEAASQAERTIHEDQVAEEQSPATVEQPPLSSSEQPRPSDGPDSSEQPGPSGLTSSEEGPPRNKRRKPNKQERAEKSMQKMLDLFVASEEKARQEFLELEHKKMQMEKEQAKVEEQREDRFLRVMQETILMMHHSAPGPVQPQLLPQPQPFSHLPQSQHNSAMYHFDLPPCNEEHDDD